MFFGFSPHGALGNWAFPTKLSNPTRDQLSHLSWFCSKIGTLTRCDRCTSSDTLINTHLSYVLLWVPTYFLTQPRGKISVGIPHKVRKAPCYEQRLTYRRVGLLCILITGRAYCETSRSNLDLKVFLRYSSMQILWHGKTFMSESLLVVSQ